VNIVYAPTRKVWRDWLSKNHDKEKEAWLVFYKKSSGKPFVPYNEAVEEALCFGWIDSVMHPHDSDSRIQRFTPRNPKSNWSELNKERARRLIKAKLMTPAGAKLLPQDLDNLEFVLPPEIEKELRKDKEVWDNFQKFDDVYKRIRVAYIWDAHKQKRMEEYERRLQSFIRATKKNRKIGTIL
jgi:uncharacterized protein YdeI (YjbR/CyaY-like superfamily)